MGSQKQKGNEDCGVPDSLVVCGVHPELLSKDDAHFRNRYHYPGTTSGVVFCNGLEGNAKQRNIIERLRRI